MMTYTQFLLRAAQNIGPVGDGINWAVAGAAAIDAAEQRVYRELGLIETVTRDSTLVATANSRNFTLPVPVAGRFVVLQGLNIVTPVGATVASGTLNPLEPASLEFIQYCYPSNTATSILAIPQYFAMVTDQTVAFGPAPGDGFTVEVVGQIRPNPLSATNPTTLLSLYFPDLFLAAAMVQLCKHGANEAAVAQVPAWETTYQTLKASTDTEEGRKRFAGASWTSKQVEPAAVPQRG